MHQLAASKHENMCIEKFFIIDFVVPLSQASRLSFSKCGLRLCRSKALRVHGGLPVYRKQPSALDELDFSKKAR